MSISLTNSVIFDIIKVKEEVLMKFVRIAFLIFLCIDFPNLFYIWLGYKALVFFDKKMKENYIANRIGFGAFCTLSLMTIGYLIRVG